MRKGTNKLFVLAFALVLVGCGNKDNEPKTYGIRNSKWASMSVAQKKEAQDRYEHEIRVSERRKVEAEMLEQQEKQAKLRMEERLANLERNQHYGHTPAPTTVIIQQPPQYAPAANPMLYHAPPATMAQAQTYAPSVEEHIRQVN